MSETEQTAVERVRRFLHSFTVESCDSPEQHIAAREAFEEVAAQNVRLMSRGIEDLHDQLAAAQADGEFYVLRFEDPDREDETFYGHGAKDAAMSRYRQSQLSWACWLLAPIAVPAEATRAAEERSSGR